MHQRFKSWLPVLMLSWLPGICAAQTISITVKDTEKVPLPGAIVQLTNNSTSEKLFRSADLSGVAMFDRLSEGLYTVNISFVGYRPLETTVSIAAGHQKFEYEMIEDAVLMKEVVVTARQPIIRQEDDRMIIDIEPMASISTNTLEILESTPGMLVDQDGGIYLNSATPAVVFINGREQKMSSRDIMTILRGLPPGSVQRIEVIRTPSARYSASASGGIVNVILKRGVKIGRFGSVRAGMNQGVYGNRFAGFSLNNSGNLNTSYLNVEYSYNNALEELNSVRQLNTGTLLYQSARTKRQAHQGYLGYGISLDALDKLNLSYDGRINGSFPGTSSLNGNVIKNPEGQVTSETENLTDNDSEFLSVRQELAALYRIDTSGSEWSTQLSYTFNRNAGTQDYRYGFVFPPANDILGEEENNNHGHFGQLQSDLVCQIQKNIKLEAGIYSTWQYADSRSDYRITLDGTQTDDPSRSKAYRYQERINAAYLQSSYNLGWKLLLKTGLRLEHTFMKGVQTVPSDTTFIVRRPDFFPYVYLSRPLFSIAGYELRAYAIYRRTISRPGYESLNPSVKYVDPYYYETGNPGLKPQFTQNIEFNISLDDMPLFAIGKNHTTDIFSSVIYTDKFNNEIAYRTYDNLGKSSEVYFRAVGGIPPTNRYFFYAGAQYNLNEYDGIYENQPLSYRRGSWRFFTYHALRVTPTTRITLNALLVTKGQMNFYEMNTFGQLNLGLNQTFLNKKLTISLSARDVLRTMVNRFRYEQGNISTTGDRYSDNRRFGINIVYNFGVPDKKEEENDLEFGTGD